MDFLALFGDWKTVNLEPPTDARSRQGVSRLPHRLAKIGKIYNQLCPPEFLGKSLHDLIEIKKKVDVHPM